MSIVMPKGFRFHPKDYELVNYYLYGKVNGEESVSPPPYLKLPEVDIYGEEPWEIWERFERQDEESLYFFAIHRKLNPKGKRIDRRTNLGTWSEGERSRPVDDENGKPIGTKRKFRYESDDSLHHAAWHMEEYSSNFSPHWVICHLKKNKRSSESKKTKDTLCEYDPPRLRGMKCNKRKNNKDYPSTSIMPKSKRLRKVDNQVVENSSVKEKDLPQSSGGANDQQFSMPGNNNYFENGLQQISTTTSSTNGKDQQFCTADLGNFMPISDVNVVDSTYTPCNNNYYNYEKDFQQSSTTTCSTYEHINSTSNLDFVVGHDDGNVIPINDAKGDDPNSWYNLWNTLLTEDYSGC
ncbi:PREDICTED: NAC domain-containing protein 2-like [Fragaria vesca subsp. vesca]|uniref:NAC domain-containing protein 2-like n=1 Tax=Fragaria vesca subsp. vesca TaxID=101020 RepID=UPI0002C30208|nr:PREDICTED: NAC domain-containing protein 2-like [Fragaria vesca subsp. vesca]